VRHYAQQNPLLTVKGLKHPFDCPCGLAFCSEEPELGFFSVRGHGDMELRRSGTAELPEEEGRAETN
jgi:hypothetical protein